MECLSREASLLKKIGIGIGVFLGLLIAIAVIVPLVVDVDKYRPQIVTLANQQINGSLELGKLSLSLWGQIRVEVDGVKLKDRQGHELVAVKNAYFHIPFLPILSGSPVLTFKMKQPTVKVVKNRAGKLNLMSLMKEKEAPAPGTAPSTPVTPPPAATPTASGNAPAIPAIAARARLGIELADALVTYQDEATALSTQVKDFNLMLKDISLSHPTELEVWADLDTQLGKTFRLKGPARLTGKAQPELRDGKVDHVSLSLNLDMDSVEMAAPGVFEKKKGMATHAEIALVGSEKEVKLEKFSFQFFNAKVDAHGTITNLASTSGSSSPVVNMDVKSNEIEFKPWVELVPMLKEFELGGAARLEAGARGPTDKLGYTANLAFSNLTAKAPKLKAQPKLDGVIHVMTDQVDKILVTFRAPGNDLKIQGKLVSFSKPRLSLDVTSPGMDLDQLIEFPPPAAAPAKGTAAPAAPTASAPATSGSKSAAPAQDFDALLAPLRENKMLGDFVADLSIGMKLIKAKGVRVTDIGCKMSFKDLAAGIDQCGLKVFSGSINANMHLQMKPKTPTYQFGTQVAGLDLGQAVASQMALFKDTLTGKANFSMTGQGASFNPDPAIANLNAKGNMKVDQASFTTIDVMKMVAETLNKTANQLGDKVPALKGKSFGNLPSGGSKYEFISSDFTIAGSKFTAPNFYAKAAANQGIDLKGDVAVGIKDYSLSTNWDVIDTYNLTHAKDITVEQNGVRVEHILTEGNSPFHFPIHVGCTIMAPCYSSTDVPVFLGKIALTNVGNAMAGKAKEEARKHIENALPKSVPPAIQDKLKGLFH